MDALLSASAEDMERAWQEYEAQWLAALVKEEVAVQVCVYSEFHLN